MVSEIPRSWSKTFPVIEDVLSLGWVDMPEKFQGTGAPGNTLEYLIDIEVNNNDYPDLNDWELKFHGGSSSLLTLFHKDPEPKGILNQVVDCFGWENDKGQISFRHTISGKSNRGFYIVNRDNKIYVKNDLNKKITPFWQHNTILEQMTGKLRRLIIVSGERNKRKVIYKKATAYWDFNITGFCNAIKKGVVLIDFDARTTKERGTSLRNHGTKFRIKISNIDEIYENKQIISNE